MLMPQVARLEAFVVSALLICSVQYLDTAS